jgi:hypothetical protein
MPVRHFFGVARLGTLAAHRNCRVSAMNRLLSLLLLVAALLCRSDAGAVTANDQARIQALINSQVSAFRRDDGPAAYSAASPGIQRFFPTVEQFMAMVTGQYQQVYRPQSFVFGSIDDTPAGPVQHVFVVGPDGISYVAQYLMEQQGDGEWKINGVAIERNAQPSI